MGIAFAFFAWRANRSGELWNSPLTSIIARAKQPELFTSILIIRLILAIFFVGFGIFWLIWPSH